MADEKISALISAGALAGTETLPIVQGGVTKKTTVQAVANLKATPNLQQVTTVSGITTNNIGVDNGTDSVYIKPLKIELSNSIGGVAGIISTSLTAATDFELPNKATGPQTFAMLSDIVGIYQAILTAANMHTFVDSLNAMTTPADADRMLIVDNSASLAKKITWANIKATLKTYFDSLTTTLTNKRITARSGTVASSATPTINTDNVDYYSITALAAAITSFTTNLSGTPTIGQTLWISITDNGTARAITWGASFESSTITLPTTTVISTRLDVAFIWNELTSVWRCVGVA